MFFSKGSLNCEKIQKYGLLPYWGRGGQRGWWKPFEEKKYFSEYLESFQPSPSKIFWAFKLVPPKVQVQAHLDSFCQLPRTYFNKSLQACTHYIICVQGSKRFNCLLAHWFSIQVSVVIIKISASLHSNPVPPFPCLHRPTDLKRVPILGTGSL